MQSYSPRRAMTRVRAELVGLGERLGLALSTLGIVLPPVPQPFYDAYLAPLGARALIVATRAGLIAALADGAATPAELAALTGLDERSTGLLLETLANFGYVRHRRGGRFVLTGVARRWLLPGGWDAVVGGLAYDGWDLIGHLEGRLHGAAPAPWHERPDDDPIWEPYQRAMAQIARTTAAVVARAIPASSPRRLLDLGGSHGLHAVAMCRRHRILQATVIDLPAAVRFGRQTVVEEGMQERVAHVEGDFFEVPLGEGWDVITAHALLHNFTPERCLELLRRARAALTPGGTFAALEIERPPIGGRGTRAGALSSLLFHTFGGRCYRPDELCRLLDEAGFQDVRVKRPARLPANFLLLGKA